MNQKSKSFEPSLPKGLPQLTVPPSLKMSLPKGLPQPVIPPSAKPQSVSKSQPKIISLGGGSVSTKITTSVVKVVVENKKGCTEYNFNSLVKSTEEDIQELNPRISQNLEPKTYEVWASRWIYYPVILLLSKDMREEWLGDLYEKNQDLFQRGYPRWHINLMNIVSSICLVMSALQIKISDFISLLKFKQD